MSTTIEVYQAPGGEFSAEVAFRGDGWVNATQMAKPFKKLPTNFTQTGPAKKYIAALERDMGVIGKAITVQQGGVCQGTWMHPDLAMEFARWLSPEFAIWCNRTVRRILNGGAAVSAEQLKALMARMEQVEQHVLFWKERAERAEADLLANKRVAQIEDGERKALEEQVEKLRSANQAVTKENEELKMAPMWTELERRQRAALKVWLKNAVVRDYAADGLSCEDVRWKAAAGLINASIAMPPVNVLRVWLKELMLEMFGEGKRNDVPVGGGTRKGWVRVAWAKGVAA